jgi:hypothetical protein
VGIIAKEGKRSIFESIRKMEDIDKTIADPLNFLLLTSNTDAHLINTTNPDFPKTKTTVKRKSFLDQFKLIKTCLKLDINIMIEQSETL